MSLVRSNASLSEALLASSLANRDRLALWAQGDSFTYGDLFSKAGRIALALEALGVAPGARVAVLAEKNVHAYSAILGALIAGCCYTPLNPRFHKGRNSAILRSSGAQVAVVDDACASRLEELVEDVPDGCVLLTPESERIPLTGRHRMATGDLERGSEFGLREAGLPRSGELAYLMFTSGTTGSPKGVPIRSSSVLDYVAGLSAISPITHDDRVLQLVDLTFDFSVHDLFLAWLNGAGLYAVPDNAVLFAPRLMAEHAITSAALVPSTAARAAERRILRPNGLPALKSTFFCGEALTPDVVQNWSAAAPNGRIVNLYGPTEATVAVSAYLVDPDHVPPFPAVPIGMPFGAQSMALFGPDRAPVEPGQTGEIALAGSQLTPGYWQAPALDREKFFEHAGQRWYRTGDLGRQVDPYGFVFAGRADRQVKINGFLVELQEVEALLKRVTGRDRLAVVPWPIRSEGSADGTVAFMTGVPLDFDHVRAQCLAVAPEYLVPKNVLFLDDLPVNQNGKIDHRALAADPRLADLSATTRNRAL